MFLLWRILLSGFSGHLHCLDGENFLWEPQCKNLGIFECCSLELPKIVTQCGDASTKNLNGKGCNNGLAKNLRTKLSSNDGVSKMNGYCMGA